MQAAPENISSLRADTSRVRLCDERVDYAIKSSPEAARPQERPYYGVWKGDVILGGSSGTMCVGMIVQEIRKGRADNLWVWNLGDGRDMTNFQGMGKVNWWGRMDGGRMILDSDKPWLGNFYAFEFGPPNDKGELHGKFRVESADRSLSAAYPVVMYRYPSRASTAPSTAAASN